MSIYRNWVLASRPWSFTMTAISVSVGATLGAVDGDFSFALYGVTLVGMIAMHAATNVINDYFDVRGGIDTLDVSTARYRPHPLVEGKLKPGQVCTFAFCLYGMASIAGLYLAASRGWIILVIGLLGFVASLTYTAPPIRYKYFGVGEFSVFLMWGPLMVEGAYFVQRQTFSEAALWVSLPFGGLVALVLLANNLRDLSDDQGKGVRTLPILIGKHNGIKLYVILVALAYLAISCMSFLGPLHLWSLIVLLSLPLAFRLSHELLREFPADADARTAQLDTAFGALLVISLILERLL